MRRLLTLSCLLVPLLAASNIAAATFQSVGLYQSFNQLVGWSESFAAANSDIVRVVEYGRSVENRPLLAIEISSQPGVNQPNKPEFLFTAGIHAREVIGSQAAYKLAEYIVNGYVAGDPACRDVLAEREVWIVPDQNPDGRVRVESATLTGTAAGFSEQRKNMDLQSGQNADNATRGVDLNRNYPHRWSDANSSVTTAEYRGPSVLSEPEASTLWTLLHDQTKFSDLLAAVDIHSGTTRVLSPWVSQSDFNANPLPTAVRAKFDALSAGMSQASGFATNRLGYSSYGTLTDSIYEEFGTYALAEEIYGSSGDYFTYFNPLTQAGIDTAVNKTIASSMYLLSDPAFDVPEPGTVVLLTAGVAGLVVGILLQRKRHAR